ncbi:MAG: RecX family transcriptional regulator [Candidatus Daviesbacteria bacterium]|nr:RecX family transcriptional regulator [Candidatus Daviesbacteria bacterium]
MKITQVEPQKTLRLRSGRRRFNVFLDGEFAFGADEDLVVSERLVSGKIIDENDLNHLIEEAEMGKLMEKMYGLFSIRQRSEREVRDYLKNLSFKRKLKDQDEISSLAIDQLIEKLKKKEMLNDSEFAKAWVEGRRRSKQKSIRALKMELMKKGIGREVIEEVLRLADARSGSSIFQSEEDLAGKALEKKMRVWKSLPRPEFKKKAISYLMRQGFDYSLIKNLVENVLKKEYTGYSEIKDSYEDDF